jgi:hypothetical protein
MDVNRIVEIENWPQAVVAVAFILASSVVPQVLGHMRDRQSAARIEAPRPEPADASAPVRHSNANGIRSILKKIWGALTRRL